MASFKTHAMGGIILAALLVTLVINVFSHPTSSQKVIYLALGLMFALFPDIDVSSISQRIFYLVFLIADAYLIYKGSYIFSAWFGLLVILPIISPHRGWTHSKAAMLLLPLPILLYPMWHTRSLDWSNLFYYTSAVTGYFSHLLLDGEIYRR